MRQTWRAKLITTDAQAVRNFRQEHGEIIYKSVSAIRSEVSRLVDLRGKDLQSVESCPTQFQQYVLGDDFRVHVVGEEVFACRIRSSGDDYLYASGRGHSLDIEDCRLPAEIEMRCKVLSASLGLHLSGIDLRCTPEGKWYCFEVYPSPRYTFFQNAADQPIDAAIASLLSQPNGVKRVAEHLSSLSCIRIDLIIAIHLRYNNCTCPSPKG